MSKHTPVPWGVYTHGDLVVSRTWDFSVVAHVEERGDGSGEANAEFIVRACNSHDDLLEAAREAQCSCSVAERESGHIVGCWMPELLAAIAKAEGQA